jgi:hypothetical protein
MGDRLPGFIFGLVVDSSGTDRIVLDYTGRSFTGRSSGTSRTTTCFWHGQLLQGQFCIRILRIQIQFVPILGIRYIGDIFVVSPWIN